MAGTYGHFKTDSDKEQVGIVVDFGEAGKFTIARAGGSNTAYEKALAKATKPYRRIIQAETIDPAMTEKLVAQVFVDTVLKGWEGVTDQDGKVFPFNRVNALKLFTDLPDLFLDIRKAALDASLFKSVVLEEDSKNLQPSLPTD